MKGWRRFGVALLAAGLGFPALGVGQSAQEQKLADAALVFQEFQRDPAAAIPVQVLQNAQGVAVLPNVIRAGFIFGGRRGKGVAVIRSGNGEWSNPIFITMTGGSFGAQIGAESTDIVLVFGNRRSVRNIGTGKFTLGGDASATVGPVGRGTRGATDLTFTSEVYYYARGRGLFAGAVLEGAKLDVDDAANSNLYPTEGGVEPLGEQSIGTPAGARHFLLSLEQAEVLSSTPARGGAPGQGSEEPEQAEEEAIIYPLGTDAPGQ